MIAKVILGTMTNARKLVSIAERISCDVELCSGRYVVNAKSMLGVLSMPEFEYGELHIHTDEENECNQVLERLLEEGLLADTNDAAKRSLYDITTFGEILIDFTWQGVNEDGQTLFAQNPGGAPANVAVAVAKLGGHTAFIGKAGKDMHGEFLKSVLEKENVETEGMLLDEKYFTTLAFVNIDENGERTFSFARKPGADTRMEKEEIDVDILDKTHIFHVGQKVRVFVADDIWQKWHKGTVKETHEDYILVDVPDICDHMQYENDYIGDVRPEYNFHLDELEG